jgi:hypothetical protein
MSSLHTKEGLMSDNEGYNNTYHTEVFSCIESDFLFNLHKISQESSKTYSHEDILKMDRILDLDGPSQKKNLRVFFEDFSEGNGNV